MKQIIEKIRPYLDVIIFMVTLLAANYFWKYTVQWEEDGVSPVYWFGLDITAPFAILTEHITQVAYWVIHLFRPTICYSFPNTLYYDSTGAAISIVWGCTGLKQSFIWFCLMLTAIGRTSTKASKIKAWLSKLYFIPLGWLCIYVFNLLRIVVITMVHEFHPEYFHFLHAYLFKYLFYFMLFMLWVWWTHWHTDKPKETT